MGSRDTGYGRARRVGWARSLRAPVRTLPRPGACSRLPGSGARVRVALVPVHWQRRAHRSCAARLAPARMMALQAPRAVGALRAQAGGGYTTGIGERVGVEVCCICISVDDPVLAGLGPA